MALPKTLKVSWNFNNLESSDAVGGLTVYDTAGNNNGFGFGFASNDSSFITKEDIKTNKKKLLGSLESSQTIRVLEEDDPRVAEIQKPASLQIVLEKSMYQIISDDILNMFADISDYTSLYLQPVDKYSEEYALIKEAREQYFSKLQNNPNLEKFLEFYKWLDSSLGYMLEQFKPETTNNISGLKNTVESHILEKNKYRHKIPLTVDSKTVFETRITGSGLYGGLGSISKYTIKTKESTSEQPGLLKNNPEVSDSVENIYSVKNIKNKNYQKKYEFFQAPGKALNARKNKENKTVFKTKFSSVDGKSEILLDESGEYSSRNSLLNKSLESRKNLKLTPLPQYDDKKSNFILKSIPAKDENFHTGSDKLNSAFPKSNNLFERNGNIIADFYYDSFNDYTGKVPKELKLDLVEPPIQFNLPAKHTITIKDSSEKVEIYSPYASVFETFSDKNKLNFKERLKDIYKHTTNFIHAASGTFYEKSLLTESINYFDIEKFEILNSVYPRTDLVGLALVRSKDKFSAFFEGSPEDIVENPLNNSIIPNRNFPWSYEDLQGSTRDQFISYNNPTHVINEFWHDSADTRRRSRGYDLSKASFGSFNCFGYPNRKNYFENEVDGVPYVTASITSSFITCSMNPYNSVYSMDCHVPIEYITNNNNVIISCSDETYGDLAPYSHFYQVLLNHGKNDVMKEYTKIFVQPKPQFIHNLFLSTASLSYQGGTRESDKIGFIFNKSYQTELDCNIKPFYNSYDEFRQNIKNKSQNYSVVPEFVCSNFPWLIKDNNAVQNTINYLSINGIARNPSITKNNFKFSLNKFVDKSSNKIKIKLKGVKKLLPYNGFYPQQRTVQIAGVFNEVFLRDTNFVKQDNDSLLKTSEQYYEGISNTLALTQPFFAPGILFNTIKAGIAMPWITTSIVSDATYSIDNLKSVKLDNKIQLPFETILDPAKNDYFRKAICFLNPTHFADDVYFLKNKGSTLKYIGNNNYISFDNEKNYKSIINNFIAETVNFFLKDGQLINFKSQKSTNNISVVPGIKYYMDLTIEKSTNFSMFNNYINPSDAEYMYIPSASFFGPPVALKISSPFKANHLDPVSYYPYCPPYFQEGNKSKIRLSYTPPSNTTSVSLKDISQNLVKEYSENKYPDNHAFQNRITLDSCVMYGVEDDSFIIQTKFETPLINFNKCQAVEMKPYNYTTIKRD